MALGANASSVRRMVVRQGLVLSGAGVVLGLVVAVLASRVMGSMLFGVSATDPATLNCQTDFVGIGSLSWKAPLFLAASDNVDDRMHGRPNESMATLFLRILFHLGDRESRPGRERGEARSGAACR